jgi:hypothetical protein
MAAHLEDEGLRLGEAVSCDLVSHEAQNRRDRPQLERVTAASLNLIEGG